jgi:putative copper export protein
VRHLRDNSLSLVFLALFLPALVGQAIAGHASYNNEQIAHLGETVSIWR